MYFSRTRCSHDGDHLAPFDIQIDPLEHMQRGTVIISLMNPFQSNHHRFSVYFDSISFLLDATLFFLLQESVRFLLF